MQNTEDKLSAMIHQRALDTLRSNFIYEFVGKCEKNRSQLHIKILFELRRTHEYNTHLFNKVLKKTSIVEKLCRKGCELGAFEVFVALNCFELLNQRVRKAWPVDAHCFYGFPFQTLDDFISNSDNAVPYLIKYDFLSFKGFADNLNKRFGRYALAKVFGLTTEYPGSAFPNMIGHYSEYGMKYVALAAIKADPEVLKFLLNYLTSIKNDSEESLDFLECEAINWSSDCELADDLFRYVRNLKDLMLRLKILFSYGYCPHRIPHCSNLKKLQSFEYWNNICGRNWKKPVKILVAKGINPFYELCDKIIRYDDLKYFANKRKHYEVLLFAVFSLMEDFSGYAVPWTAYMNKIHNQEKGYSLQEDIKQMYKYCFGRMVLNQEFINLDLWNEFVSMIEVAQSCWDEAGDDVEEYKKLIRDRLSFH